MARKEPAFRIAREGRPFVVVPAVLAAVLAAAALATGMAVLGVLAGLAALAAGFCAFFFRDPRRIVPGDPDAIVSPADGRVMAVERRDGRWRIAIFLSIFDVHVNRSPEAGTVERVAYHKGRFLAAFRPEAARVNERNHVVLRTARGRVEVVQIAGLVARRIVCRLAPGASVGRGERFGLIRFGSCTELWLPDTAEPAVRPGQRVVGGQTVISRWGSGGADR